MPPPAPDTDPGRPHPYESLYRRQPGEPIQPSRPTPRHFEQHLSRPDGAQEGFGWLYRPEPGPPDPAPPPTAAPPPSLPQPGRRSRRPLVIALILLLVAALVTVVLLSGAGGDQPGLGVTGRGGDRRHEPPTVMVWEVAFAG